MNTRRFWFVALTMTFLCGCGRQNAQPTAFPIPPAHKDTMPVDSTAGDQRTSDEAADQFRPPEAALAEFRSSLGRAFEAMRKQGIVAEPKFEDCARCAVATMTDLLQERSAPGGVYWHDQDDDNLERGEDLNIGFVAREDRDAVAIAQKLVAALRAEGLTVEWDGSAEKRVTVKVLWSMAHPPTTFQPRVRLERVAHIPGRGKGLQGDLAVRGKYVYWSLAGELRVVDVSDPAKPQVGGTLEIENLSDWVCVSGRYAFVVDDERLLIVDVSDPAAPRVVGSCDVGAEVRIWGVAVQGQYAYATDGGSVVVIDVSDPATPKRVGRGKVECGEGITVAGNYAYLPCDSDGMHIVDISDPRAPKHVTAFRGSAGALHVTVAGKLAYITGGEDGIELNIVDISDPKQPKPVGRFGDGMSGGVAVQGDYAYVAAGNLDVVDVSNPAAPKLVGFYRDDECMTAWRVAVVDEYVYVLGDGIEGFSILRVVWAEHDGKEPEAIP